MHAEPEGWSLTRWSFPSVPDGAWCEYAGPGGTTATLRFSPSTSALVDVTVQAEPVTRRLLRRVPLGELERHARAEVTTWASVYAPSRPSAVTDLEEELARYGGDALLGSSALLGQPWKTFVDNFRIVRPGRRGRPEIEYALIAATYVTRCVNGGEPVAALARDYHVSVSQMRSLLLSARNRDLLTPAPKGKVGGTLTEHALNVLREEGKGDGTR